MTKIEFSEKEDKILGFLIKGHTQSNIYGNDIVCASISATSQMTLNGLIEVLNIKKLNYEIKDGYMLCDLSECLFEDIEKSQDILISLKLILEEIACNYPKNVQFRIRRYGR